MCALYGTVIQVLEHIVDLDQAAAEITRRQPGWQAIGLAVGPVTWRDGTTRWPQQFETDRTQVGDPDSVGVHISGPRDTELKIVLFCGGWADLDYYAGDDDFGALPKPELSSATEFGALLDSCVARVFGHVGGAGTRSEVASTRVA